MNRELREVRRYWPRAKYVGLHRTERPHREYAANGCKLLAYLDGRYCVSDCVTRVWVWPPELFRTIAEAMRAAGFGPRRWGEYASRLKRARTVLRRRGSYVAIVTLDWPPRLVSTQRPRKGARLGRRKRSPDGMGKNWRSAARGGVK